MFQRHAIDTVRTALADTPVVVVQGARQVGKSTLLHQLVAGGFKGRLRTLDDEATLRAALDDPVSFVHGLGEHAVIDEVQRAPGLFRAIKRSVDRDRRPGRFLLSGSANILQVPQLADSLAGRVEIVTLWPLSQGELHGRREGFVDAVFATQLGTVAPSILSRTALATLAVRGGYPEAVQRTDQRPRDRWFRNYLTTTLERDVKVFTDIEDLDRMRSLLRIVGERTATILNYAGLASDTGIPETTVKRYLRTLQAMFITRILQPWSRTRSRRETRAPKIHVVDPGLAAHLMGLDLTTVDSDGRLRGRLFEGFVVTELLRQITWARLDVTPYHYRTSRSVEVDLVLEARGGRAVGIEVKAGATVERRDVAGLEALAAAAGARFVRGIVLYAGEEPVQFGPKIWALPIEALWTLGATAVRRAAR